MFPVLRTITIVLCLFTSLANADETRANAGFRIIDIEDPVSRKPMRAAVVFPTEDRADVTKIGPLEIPATKDATVQRGRHPL